jgi:putative oxidoreductase
MIGAMMLLSHGYGKLSNFGDFAAKFSDPIGIGATASLTLAVFAEFFCSLGVFFGFLTRLAAIPLLTTMLVASMIVHIHDPWARQEFALLYAIVYVSLIFLGPGKYSLDHLISERLANKPTKSQAEIEM